MKRINTSLLLLAIAILAFGFIKKTDGEQTGNTVGTNIGNLAPELKYANPEGKEIALSSLKGKIVLIDFWASWCGPCRMENPYVVAAYNKYKDKKFKGAKGFTIYGVSLDQNPVAWKNGIQKDQLIWPDHVSDLKGWYSEAAQKYGVSAIPTNFLIDGNGVIVAKALRGANLEAELEKLIAK